MRLIRRWLPRAMSEPQDLAARGQLLLASTMAGTAFDNAQVGLVHAIAHSVGGRHGVHHGLANSIALPHVIRFNAPDAANVYAELARAAGISSSTSDEEATEALAKDVAELARGAGLPLRYRDVGVPESDLQAIAELAVSDGSIVYNPRMAMDPALVLEVLRAAW